MFFQTIYGLLAESTEVGISIRRVNDKLTVAVMPRHNELKERATDSFIPLVASGTPEELDGGFANIMAAPVAKAVGIMTNLKEFERQAEKAATKGKPKAAVEKETKEAKEAKEKNDRLDKLMKRVDESVTAPGRAGGKGVREDATANGRGGGGGPRRLRRGGRGGGGVLFYGGAIPAVASIRCCRWRVRAATVLRWSRCVACSSVTGGLKTTTDR